MHHSPLRRAALLAIVLLAFAAAPTAFAAGPGGPGVGWIRVGHLSPDMPPVDIYLAPFGQAQNLVIREARYGAVTPYSTLAPGQYTWSVRPVGATADTPPALTATITIAENTASTLLIFQTGPRNSPQSSLITDNMATPATGDGRIRVVQGSARPTPVTVSLSPGPVLGADLPYGATTQYINVPAGNAALKAVAGDVRDTTNVPVTAGSVQTVLVTQESGGLKVTPVMDGISPGTPPLLGVQAGGGGTAGAAGSSPVWPVIAAVGLAGIFLLLPGRRRGRGW
jgi:uncharacterized protein DUF4397